MRERHIEPREFHVNWCRWMPFRGRVGGGKEGGVGRRCRAGAGEGRRIVVPDRSWGILFEKSHSRTSETKHSADAVVVNADECFHRNMERSL